MQQKRGAGGKPFYFAAVAVLVLALWDLLLRLLLGRNFAFIAGRIRVRIPYITNLVYLVIIIALIIVGAVVSKSKKTREKTVGGAPFFLMAAAIFVIGLSEIFVSTSYDFVRGKIDLLGSSYGGILRPIVGGGFSTSIIIATAIYLVIALVFIFIGRSKMKKDKTGVVGASPAVRSAFDERLKSAKESGGGAVDEAAEAKLFAISIQEARLVAPASAKFAPLEHMSCILDKRGVYKVAGYVDSQNSYGAQIRTQFDLKVKNENGEWKLVGAGVYTAKAWGFALIFAGIFCDMVAFFITDSDIFGPILGVGMVMFVFGLLLTILGRK